MGILVTDKSTGRTIQSMTIVTGTKAVSGDNALIAAPAAGIRIVVKDIVVQNESAVATTILLKDGATAKWRAYLEGYKGFTASFAEGEEWRLTAATALNLNLSGANSHGYSVRYWTETA